MWEPVIRAITQMSQAMYSQSDAAIQAVCMFAWTEIFGWIAGIVIGIAIIKAFFDADLMQSVHRIAGVLLPLLVVAYFIQPGTGGCRVVTIKTDAIAGGAKLTSLVAPSFAGEAGALTEFAARRTTQIMSGFLADLVRASHRPDTSAAQRQPGAEPTSAPSNP